MKKKHIGILLLAILSALVFTACGGKKENSEVKTDTKAEQVSQEEETADAEEKEKDEIVPEPGTDHTYKDLMVPFDELVPSDRIVLIQNTLNFGMMGFYTEETKPVTEEITYKEGNAEAYPISYTLDFLNNEITGNVTVTNAEGEVTEFSAEEFAEMYVIVDFTSSEPVILYNPKTGAETTLAYAVTSEGEGIYSVSADTEHNTADIIKSCGWSEEETYRLMATDKFYIPVEPEYLKIGKLRGTLSGALNASFDGMVIASGKINDPVYFEKSEN